MIISPTIALTFKYLALPNGLGGRGGVQRFFLLSQNIPFNEKLVSFEEWTEEKKRLISSGENPSGTVPVIYATENSNEALVQHIATSRYLAQVHKVTSATPYEDYVQDLVADEYQGFRDKWVGVAFSGTEEQRKTYRTDDLPKLLNKFDRLYAKFKQHTVYLSVSKATGQPLWGDAAIFGLLRDNILTGFVTLDELTENYPHLAFLYTNYERIPAVAAWIDEKKKANPNADAA